MHDASMGSRVVLLKKTLYVYVIDRTLTKYVKLYYSVPQKYWSILAFLDKHWMHDVYSYRNIIEMQRARSYMTVTQTRDPFVYG
jgi:hypothetical protein